MPGDETCGLKLSQSERELLANLLMGDYQLEERIEQTPAGQEVQFGFAELELLDEVLAIELDHMADPSHRKTVTQVRKRIGLLLSL